MITWAVAWYRVQSMKLLITRKDLNVIKTDDAIFFITGFFDVLIVVVITLIVAGIFKVH